MADLTQKTSGLFTRWTQRREQVAAEEQAQATVTKATVATQTMANDPDAAVTESSATAQAEVQSAAHGNESIYAAEPEDPHRMLSAAELPNPAEIEIGGSFAQFMGDNIDPAAKTAALRALWKQPHFNEIDGLLEYALDYSNQTKLTAEVSAELAKKVFRYVTEERKEPEEASALVQQSNSTNSTTRSELETELAAEPIADNLDGESDDLPQNEPEHAVQAQAQVV
jgi:hypothetical protein